MLREQIISGKYPPSSSLSAQTKRAPELGADVAVVNRAVGQLEREGFVQVEHGKPTVILARRPYEATIEMPRLGEPRAGELAGLQAALSEAAAAGPAVTQTRAAIAGDRARIWMVVVVTADPAKAVSVAFAIACAAAKDGWDSAAAQTWSLPDD